MANYDETMQFIIELCCESVETTKRRVKIRFKVGQNKMFKV